MISSKRLTELRPGDYTGWGTVRDIRMTPDGQYMVIFDDRGAEYRKTWEWDSPICIIT